MSLMEGIQKRRSIRYSGVQLHKLPATSYKPQATSHKLQATSESKLTQTSESSGTNGIFKIQRQECVSDKNGEENKGDPIRGSYVTRMIKTCSHIKREGMYI